MKDVEVERSDWPGEELKLVGGLVLAMRPQTVAIIGGANPRAGEVLRKYLPQGVTISSDPAGAELILVNGPGDGEFEQEILDKLRQMRFEKAPIVLFNDTRKWEMLRFCREIAYPKLDMTSFGRWTGTLLVELAA